MKRVKLVTDSDSCDESPKKRKKLETLFSTTEFLEIARFCFPEQQIILEQMGDTFPESFWQEVLNSLHDYKPRLSFFTRLVGGQYECHCAQSRLGIYTDLELAKKDMVNLYEKIWLAQAEHWLSKDMFDKGHEAYLSTAQRNDLFMSFTFSGEMHDLHRIGVITLENEEMPPDETLQMLDANRDWGYDVEIRDDIRKWLPDSALGLKAYMPDNRSFREKVLNPRWYMLYHIKHYRDCFFCLDGAVTEDSDKIKEYLKPKLKTLNNDDEEEITTERLHELEHQLKEICAQSSSSDFGSSEYLARHKLMREVSDKVSFLKPLVHLCNSICMCKHNIDGAKPFNDDAVQVGAIVRFNSPHMHAGMSLEQRLKEALPHGEPILFDPLVDTF